HSILYYRYLSTLPSIVLISTSDASYDAPIPHISGTPALIPTYDSAFPDRSTL
ncbi:hypothetical protein RSAG8_06141, partial [Rhizoctonia solani AG-8 WAC10335]